MSVPRPLLLSLALTVALATLALPSLAASLVMPIAGELAYGIPHDVATSGNYAFVAAQGALAVFDISNPAHPSLAATVDTPGSAEGVAISGDYAYVADWDAGLRVVDISDPAAPVEVGNLDTPGYAYGVAVSGDYAYVADHAAGLRIVDISTPAAPASAGVADTPGYAWAVAVAGNYAYVADGFGGLAALDVTNPASPSSVATFAAADKVVDVAISADGDYVFYTDGTEGIGVLDISNPAAPVSLGLKLGSELSGSGMGLFADGDTLYLASGTGGIYAVDITDPANPGVLEALDTPGSAFAVAVSGTTAAVADDSGGFRLIDISKVPAPAIVSQAQTPGNAEAVAVSDDMAYVADSDGGLRAFDVSDPQVPDELWDCTEGGLQAMDVAVSGNYAYVAHWGGELRILDVSNPSGPACSYGSSSTGGHPSGIALAIAVSRAYVAAGEVGLAVVDISDPAVPAVLDAIDTDGTANDVAVSGDYAFIADGAFGLVIMDVSTATGVVVATADTAGYAWGVDYADGYAYLASGDAGLEVFDVSTPAAPSLVATLGPLGGLTGSAHSVVVSGEFAYVSAGGRGLTAVRIDLGNPVTSERLQAVSTCGTPSVPGPSDLTLAGGYAYVADSEAGLVIVDVLQPYSELARCESPAYGEKLAVSGQSDGTGVVYLASGPAGLQVVQVTDSEEADDPALIRSNRTLGDVTDIALQGTTYGYVTDARGRMTVMNMSNPTNPFAVGSVETPGSALGVGALQIGGADYALVADGYEGLSVISAVNKAVPVRKTSYNTPGWCAEAVGATLTGDPFALVADGESGLRLINVSPVGTAPVTIFSEGFETGVTEWTQSGTVEWYSGSPKRGLHGVRLRQDGSIVQTITTEGHSGILVTFYLGASALEGSEYVRAEWYDGTTWATLAEIANGDTEEDGALHYYSIELPSAADDNTSFALRFSVVGDELEDYGYLDDVTVKANSSSQPFEVGFYNTPGQARGVTRAGDYACVADGTGGVRVVDITAPGSPTQTGYLDTAGYAQAVTLATYDRVLAVADGDNGVLLVDIKDPAAPVEVAHYDTPGWASDVKVLDDFAYVADTGWGVTVLQLWYSFRDILFGNWAFFQIEGAVDNDITKGYTDGLYHPEYKVTRDLICVFIARAEGWVSIHEPMNTAPALYDDVPAGYWAGLAIQACGANNVVKGYSDKFFRPTLPVERDDMAVFIARAQGWVGIYEAMDTEGELFTDVPAQYWCGKAIKACVDNGVVRGYPDGSYKPNVAVTRDQMAVYLARTYGF